MLAFLVGCGPSLPPQVENIYTHIDQIPDFNQDIRPILADRCFPCHGPDQNKLEAGLRLDQEESAKGFLPEHPRLRAIHAGNPGQSELVKRILHSDPEMVMPPPESKLTLSDQEKAILIRWIEEGAVYQQHWAFIPPKKEDIPKGENAIDYLINRELEAQGLVQNEEADKNILLRRLSFDLTGLPPTIPELNDFKEDHDEQAYTRVVERLLASPHFGERMAVDWLDVARYADTHGYTVDRYRDVSPYRDWVIKSFNENMPYDDFVTWQLAGDLLPEGIKDQKIATAFLRMHPQNMEGGIIPEEFRVEYVADRTNTFATAFMGMTMSCAKCHDHKFDPISQKEYYQLFSFFNNINEAGQISFNNAMPVPTMLLTDEKQDSLIEFFAGKITELESEKSKLKEHLQPQAEEWIVKEEYKSSLFQELNRSEVGHFSLDGNLVNTINHQKGKMDRTNSSTESPDFTEGFRGQGLLLNGDAWLDLGGIGAFDRYEPFTVSLHAKIPSDLKEGVIFHSGIGAVLYNFRGFHLAIKDNRLELLMAHTAPDNAIIRYSDIKIPRDDWIQLAMVYDGSGKAEGLNVYLNGNLVKAITDTDNLYKTLKFDFANQKEPGIQVGARWRGKGIGGSIVDEIQIFKKELSALEIKYLSGKGDLNQLIAKDASSLSREEREDLVGFFVKKDPSINRVEEQLFQWRGKMCRYVDTIGELMIFKEMPQPRKAFILDRGQYNTYKDQVWPATPMSIMPMDSALKNPNRLDLAEWLFNPEHPLTARVLVNRIWQQFFGRGLVRTAEDFGNQGSAPTHPALLDYIAVTFMESGWNVKDLIRMIVQSGTYRQSSISTVDQRASDPENVYLSRGPSKRLSAEMIRDQALAASGLLVRNVGGPSVFPYQPEGLWKVNGAAYSQSEGDDLYRRSMYTVWKRSVPHPTQSTFDAPERSECSMRRQQTNTPLQALILMNDPIFIEAAIQLGEQILDSGEISPVFQKLTGRMPAEEELLELRNLYQENLQAFTTSPVKSKGWMRYGDKISDRQLKSAAYAVVASTILNTDASIFKR
ncbi:MAG: DUF1553 domain-containing protein [Saprospiraceae bacterium]|nr:DUF1553 domain-containing protein [Saprospiraceae bacterium]